MILLDLSRCCWQRMPVSDQPNAAERVRIRIDEWLAKHGHGSKTVFADAIASQFGESKSRSWVTGLITKKGKKQDLRLKDLDDVAKIIGVQPGELVQYFGRVWLDASMEESRVVRYMRSLPAQKRAHFVETLDFLFRPQLESLEEQAHERTRQTLEARAREREGTRTTESSTFRRKKTG